MRRGRIKTPPEEGARVYHCMSRTVNSERLFTTVDKEQLRQFIWQVADFCGVEVVTYTILCNHFHLVLRVPEKHEVAAQEVVRRYERLYPKINRQAHWPHLQRLVATGAPEGLAWVERQRKQMGDVSEALKLLKQLFTQWINKNKKRHGTLWCERFKSVLVEEGAAVRITSAYVDLNSVRANLVKDPKEYRFSGYAEAVAGNLLARKGICDLMGIPDWKEASAAYRQYLFGAGAMPSLKGAKISAEALDEVIRQRGKLPLSDLLRCRIRYLTEGAVLGSQAFVAAEMAKLQAKKHRTRALDPTPLPSVTDWGPLTHLRRCRGGIEVS